MRKTGEMLAAAMVIMLLAVGCQRSDERKENIGVSTPTEAVTAEETPTPVTTEAAVPTAIPTEAVTPTVIPTEALTGTLTPTEATTEALAPTPTGIEEDPAEDDPDKRTGVFNWKTRSQKYGYDNYELYTSDGSTKVEKKNSNIYVNEKPVYTAAYSDEAHFWIIDLDKSDDEEEILVIDYQNFYSWEKRLIKTVFSSKKAGDFCRLTVSVFEKDGTLIFNNTAFYNGDPGYVTLWGDGKIYLDKAYVDLPPEGYYADHITFVTVAEEQDNGKKKRTIVPEERELFFQSKIGGCPKIYTARPFYAYSVNDNSLTEISPQIITLSSAGSEKLYFSAEDKNAYWVDIHRSNNGWIIGESYDTSVWLQLGENCPSALYPVRLPIIKCEKEALPLTEFIYAYSGVAKDESELLADNRKDLWNSLINGEAELIFSTLPDTEEELQNIDKSGLEFSVRPVIALSGCGIPLNGTHWELDTQWKFDSHDYYNKRATDDSSIIYAVIREDAETFSHARELFKWFGLGKVVKHVNGIAYFTDDPETYQAIRDYTVKDPSPYEYDKSIIESGYDDDYILDATPYTEGAVDEEDILEFGTDYYNDYWEDFVSVEQWYAYITCDACRLMSKNSERYQELKAAVEEINLKLAGRVEEVIRMGQDTIESMATEPSDRFNCDIYSSDLEICRADKKVLSILLNGEYYFHPYGYERVLKDFGTETINLDILTGKRIDLNDVCTGCELLTAAIVAELNRDYPDECFDEDATAISGLITEGKLLWLLDYEGITIRINGQDIGRDNSLIYETTILAGMYPELIRESYFTEEYAAQIGRGITVYNKNERTKERITVEKVEAEDVSRYDGQYYLVRNNEKVPTGLFYGEYNGLKNAFFVHMKGGDYLYMDEWVGDEDDALSVVKVSRDEQPSILMQTGNHNLLWHALIVSDGFSLVTRRRTFGTYYDTKYYKIGENGLPVTSDKYFSAGRVEHRLMENCRFSVIDPETDEIIGKTVLLKGTTLYQERTDSYKFVDFSTDDGTWIRLVGGDEYWGHIMTDVCYAD